MLITLATFTFDQLYQYFTRHEWSFDRVVCALNDILTPYAAFSASNQCHPLLLPVLKPIVTSGDGNCMFNALSPHYSRD